MEIERQVRVVRSKTALAGLLGFVAGVGVLAGSGEAQGLKLPAMLFGFLVIVGSIVALVRAGGQRSESFDYPSTTKPVSELIGPRRGN